LVTVVGRALSYLRSENLVDAIVLAAVALLAIGSGAALWLGIRSRHPAAFDVLGPDRYLMAIGTGLLGLACGHVATWRRSQARAGALGRGSGEGHGRQFVVLLMLIGYILLLEVVGYAVATIVFLSASFLFYGEAPVWRAVALGAGVGLLFWAVFVRVGGVLFPRALLFG
jgi:hypothetical protein